MRGAYSSQEVMRMDSDMRPYLCSVCGYVYQAMVGDAARGVPPGTGFPDLPEEWACPRCHQGKELFAPMET